MCWKTYKLDELKVVDLLNMKFFSSRSIVTCSLISWDLKLSLSDALSGISSVVNCPAKPDRKVDSVRF